MENSTKMMTEEELKEFFPDFQSGPLDHYRKKATFSWRIMKLVYNNYASIKIKHDIWKFMETHPLFQHPSTRLTLDEERHLTIKRMYAIYNEQFASFEKVKGHIINKRVISGICYDKNRFSNYQWYDVDPIAVEKCCRTYYESTNSCNGVAIFAGIAAEPNIFQAESEAMFMFNSSLAVKISLTFRMFANSIQGSGRAHHYHFIEDIQKGKIGGCFALTEVAHGSNAKGMQTTATYCPETKEFVINSANFEAAKFWVGVLGKCATHAIVYAMLISKGKNHGLHAFVVPIRDPKTLRLYPGVIAGDIGEKIGLNGLDNGFVMFNNYHIPKENALDKLGGVDDNGDYKTPFRDPKKRFGAALGILSGGRVHITSISTNYLQKAIVIAIRYSAVRRQFGPENSGEEVPVLEYQQQQIRLLPHLAATYAYRIFCTWFGVLHIKITIDNYAGVQENAAARGIEIHALSSAVKPVCGWGARDGIQAAREACGGHGYLTAAGIGDLRNDNDANCTYEGENSLLLQQASNWLLAVWPRRGTITPEDTPLGTLEFLENVDDVLKNTCSWQGDELVDPHNLTVMYKWLTAYSLKITYEKVSQLKQNGKDNWESKNDSQSYYAVMLSVVYGENFIVNHFYKTAKSFGDVKCREVLLKLMSLFAAYSLEKHIATLFIGGYFSSRQGVDLRAGILRLCKELSPQAVSLVDSLAPPDFCLNSVLGNSDGQVYKHLQDSVMSYPGAMSRPHWWKDVVFWESYVQSKL